MTDLAITVAETAEVIAIVSPDETVVEVVVVVPEIVVDVGPVGPPGQIGPQGPQGDTGPAGAQGDPGPVGGDSMVPGPPGEQGEQGPPGPTGPQGVKGDIGATGATGTTGSTGPQGAPGSTGPAGATGPTGPQGVPGPTGADGPQGDPGEPGGSLLSAFWSYATNVAAPPANGQIRTNTGMTTIWIAEVDTDGMNRFGGLATAEVGDTIILRAANGTYANLLITGLPVDSGTYWTIPISVTSGTVTKGARTQLGILSPVPQGIPAGGTTRQVLAKTSATDYAVNWRDPNWIVVKATQPTAADYGLTTIPVGAIWVQSP
jgi:hypothetical protein